MRITKKQLLQIIKEEIELVLTNEEVEEFFGVKVEELEKEELTEAEAGDDNPWAICTDSVGRGDEDKYERCIKKVKEKNK